MNKNNKHIIISVLLLLASYSLFAQGFRDSFMGTYHCKETATQNGVSSSIYMNLYLTASTTAIDSFSFADSIPWWFPTMKLYADSTFTDYSFCIGCAHGKFYDGDSIYVFHLTSSGGQALYYDYRGKKITTGIKEIIDEGSIFIYPNPSSSTVNIELNKVYKNINVELYTIMGKKINVPILFNVGNKIILDIRNKEPGLYFLKIIIDGSSICKKIVIE